MMMTDPQAEAERILETEVRKREAAEQERDTLRAQLQEAHARLDRLVGPCKAEDHISRVCERGTHSCNVRHRAQLTTAQEQKQHQLDDACPRCGGSFEATGGKPVSGPYQCQRCTCEDFHAD